MKPILLVTKKGLSIDVRLLLCLEDKTANIFIEIHLSAVFNTILIFCKYFCKILSW